MLIIGCDYHPSVQQIAFVSAADQNSSALRPLPLKRQEAANNRQNGMTEAALKGPYISLKFRARCPSTVSVVAWYRTVGAFHED